jgi:hypothetical protein
MDSSREMRSAPSARKNSAKSRSSLVLRARRAIFEKMRPEILWAFTSSIMRRASGWAMTALPETPARLYRVTTSHPRISA